MFDKFYLISIVSKHSRRDGKDDRPCGAEGGGTLPPVQVFGDKIK